MDYGGRIPTLSRKFGTAYWWGDGKPVKNTQGAREPSGA